MNRTHDRTRHPASSLLPRLKRKALPVSLSLLGMVAGSLLPCGEAVAAGPAAGTLPTGNSIVSGTATVNTTGTTLTVTQTSAQLAMNWTSFDIASNANVVFAQPGANAIALNRIGIGSGSPTASQIFGGLNANGQVFLINPAGIVFGSSASVNVGGLLASTLDMNPATLAGGAQTFHLDKGTATGSIVNQGTISAASGGGVVLVGGSVSNSGYILADAGHIFLDGADHATLDFDGNNLINVTVTGALASGSGTAVDNAGLLQSSGGMVVLQASATPGLFTQMVNNSGVIKADGISTINSGAGGTVQLIGNGGGVVSTNAMSANAATGGTAGSVAITSDQAVNVSGSMSTTGLAGSGVSLTGNALTLGATINSGASPTTLTSQGVITQTAGSLSAATLTGSSAGTTTLTQAGNAISTLGNYASGGDLSLATSAGLTLNGAVSGHNVTLNALGGSINQTGGALSAASLSGGSSGATSLVQTGNAINALGNYTSGGDLALTTSGALTLTGPVSGNNVTLTALGGAISQTGGALTAATLNGSSSGATTLTQAGNAIGALGNYVSAGDLALSSIGNLALNGAVIGNNVTLNVTGAISEGVNGSLTASGLTGSTGGSTALDQANNRIAQLNGFSASGFSLKNAQALNVTNTLSGGSAVTLTTTSGDLTLNGAVSGTNVALNASAGAVNQTGGTLSAGTLSGGSSAGTTLTQAGNTISTLGNYASGGDLALATSGALTLNGAVSGNNVTLTALGGAISQTGGALTATTLSGSSSGATTLTQAGNAISALGNYNSGGDLALSDTGNLALNGAVSGGNVALNVTGAISEGINGSLTASGLTGSSGGSTTLDQANNKVAQLNGFSANGFNLKNAQALSVTNTLSGTSAVTLTTTSGDLTLNGAVSGANVSLNANAGAVTQAGGTLTAGTLSGGSSGPTTLTQTGNAISALGNYSTGGNLAVSTGGNLSVSGPVSGANVSLTGGNTIGLGANVTATGTLGLYGAAVTQSAGTLKAATLTGQSTGATSLTQPTNVIGALGTYTSNGFSLVNASGLQVTGALTGGASVALTTQSGNLVINNAVSGASVALNAGGAISEGVGGTLSTSVLTGGSSGDTTLAQSGNQIGSLGNYNSGGGFTLTNGAAIAQGTGSTLTVAGATALNAGSNAIVLTNGNQLQQGVSATGSGIAITNSGNLDITSLSPGLNNPVSLVSLHGALSLPGAPINTGTADLALSSYAVLAPLVDLSGANVLLSGYLGISLAHNVNATNTLSLVSTNGAVAQTGGALNAGALTGQSAGATWLTQGNNKVGTISGYTSGSDFSLTNAQAIGQTGALVVQGNTALNAGNNTITLGLNNDLHGAVGITGGSTQINNDRGLSFNTSNVLGNLTATTANAAITQVGALTVSGASTFNAGAAPITLAYANGSGQWANSFGTQVNAIGTGITLASQSNLIMGTLTDGANGAVNLMSGGTLSLPSTPINTGTSDLTLVSAGGPLTTTANLAGNNVSLSGSQGVTLANNITAARNLTLTSSNGAITQTAGTLVANTLSGQSAGATSLNQPTNAINTLGNYASNGFSLADANPLTVSGTLTGTGGNIALTTTGGSDLTVAGAVTGANVTLTAGNQLGLNANVNATGALGLYGAAITQSAGVLTAATLTGKSTSATSLAQANQITQLNGFIANGFALNNAGPLNVAGTLSGGSSVALSVQSGDLALNGAVTGSTVTLDAAGNISEGTSGSIATASLGGSSGGSTALTQANNAIAQLGGFSANGFSLADGTALAITGPLSSSAVTLNVNGAVTEGAGGSIVTGTLSGASTGSTTLDQAANRITSLGNYSSGGDFNLANGAAIAQSGLLAVQGKTTLNAGTNAITLGNNNTLGGAVSLTGGNTLINNAGVLTLDTSSISGNLTATTTSNAAITQTAGALSVSGQSTFNAGAGAITLGSGNRLLGAVSLTGGNVQINNAVALDLGASTVSGNLSASAANAAITQTGALGVMGTSTFNAGSGAIALMSPGNAFGSTVNATGTGIAIGSSGDLHMGALSDGTNGAIRLIAGRTLYLPNQAIDTGAADLTLSSLGGVLATASALNGAHVSLSGSQGMTLAHDVSASQSLNLASSNGAITQTAGSLKAPLLTGSSQGTTALTQANQITQLGSFAANGFSLTNAGALTVAGPLTSTGSVALTTHSGDLTLLGAMSGTDVSLIAANGAVNQTGGTLTANTLSGHSSGATSLTLGVNTIGNVGSYSSGGDFSLGDASALTVSGPLTSGGNMTLGTSGNLTLAGSVSGQAVTLNTGAGNVNQTAGTLTAGTLTGGSSGDTLLTQANQIGLLGGYSSGGNFSLTNGAAIAQSGALQVQGAATLNAGGNAITLTNTANHLGSVLSLTGGNTQIVNSGPLTLGASQINGSLSIISNDPAIGQTAPLHVRGSSYFNAGTGSIALTNTGNRLDGPVTAIGTGIAITNADDLGIASLSNGPNGAVSLISLGGTLTLPGTAITTGSADLLLTSGGGALSTAADLSGANVTLSGSTGLNLGNTITAANSLNLLSSHGAINQSAGLLNAALLDGSSAGATSLGQSNQVRNVGSFSANGFSLTNAGGLIVAGPLLSSGDVSLTTQSGDLDIAGTLSGQHVALNAAGAISENTSGSLIATALSGNAGGTTSLGTQDQPIANHIGTLGGFASLAGFSLTNGPTLTLASVGGSSYTVNAGTSPLYLSVLHGDLLQAGTTPLYDSQGTFAASGHIGLATAPIYEFGTLPYLVESIGLPPAYFYALDREGNALPDFGLLSINVPITMSSGHAQNGNNHLDSYIDASIITASYRAYGIVPSGIRLPPDQQACDPQDSADCQSD
ncbi:beta strand repeat-containing protein [Dyella japonica]|uniref:Filamentous haemagglutinin FhaB/tRNA nuclease CdiA-like TPS domain-containing protein n=1 Tax=Dyella japonica A8 TaxID=1217721 RepID=A0A075K3E1_9GAMM|nr:filamentous hemagglutinin N-terminal domain-containing protein [Dyella japonica]AIF48217.1 hypothetical protein HY57_13630 [Dyella japonica A8]